MSLGKMSLNNVTLIQSEKSFLKVYDLPEEFNETIKKVIEETDNKLLVNPPILVYGKVRKQRRCIAFLSNDSIGYRYSGQLVKSQRLTEHSKLVLDYINEKFNTDYNGILINKYLSGKDYIGRHSDNESALSKVGVMAISFGAVRKFRIRDKNTKRIVKDIPTLPNKIIHMGGEFQKEFTHEIPIERKVKEPRWSFTFRKHLI